MGEVLVLVLAAAATAVTRSQTRVFQVSCLGTQKDKPLFIISTQNCSIYERKLALTKLVDEDMLLALAHQKYQEGNYKQALENCSAVYESNTCHTDNLLLLGATYYQLRNFDMCIAKNEEALHLNPRFAECYGNMANAWKPFLLFTFIRMQEKGNLDLAIQFYLIAIEINSDSERAVNIVNGTEDSPWYCLNVMQAIKAHKRTFNSLEVAHIYKEGPSQFL